MLRHPFLLENLQHGFLRHWPLLRIALQVVALHLSAPRSAQTRAAQFHMQLPPHCPRHPLRPESEQEQVAGVVGEATVVTNVDASVIVVVEVVVASVVVEVVVVASVVVGVVVTSVVVVAWVVVVGGDESSTASWPM